MGFLEFKKVYKVYTAGVKALDNVNLSIEKGEFVFLWGATGAGKTTLMKLITREELPTSGEVWLERCKISSLEDRYLPILRRNLGVVFQDLKLVPHWTVFENLISPLLVLGVKKRDAHRLAEGILDLVHLQDKKHHKTEWLSGGEKQKLCLGRALIHRPHLVLADEPTGNLDGATALGLVGTLFEFSERSGATVIIATHSEKLVNRFPGRLVVLDKGKIIQS